MTNHRMGMRSAILFATSLCVALHASAADDIRAQLAIGEEPYFIGLPVPIQITVSGVEQTPTPKWRLARELPDGATLTLTNVSPQVSSRTFIRNGRTVVNESETKFVFTFQLVSNQPGSVPVGEIEIEQDGNKTSVIVPAFSFNDVPVDSDMLVEVSLPDGPLYVGQRVPISVLWGYNGDLARVRDLRLTSPFFNQFTFDDREVRRNDTYAVFASKQGDTNVRAGRDQETRDGKRYEILKFDRTLVASEVGTFDFESVFADIEYVTRFRRSVFGSTRRPAATEPRRGRSGPFTVEVLPLPSNPPASYAGAIGSGFRLDVDVLGSTIVNVGDPIKVKLTVTGNGNVDEIGLPPLIGDSAFDASQFRVPDEKLAGTISKNSKEFVTQVRVVDPAVNQIPAIAYSWFDPSVGDYQTALSEPRSITVSAAKRVSANDVVSAVPKSSDSPKGNDSSPNAAPPGQSDSLGNVNLAGADLSINIDATELAQPATNSNDILQLAMYAFGLTVLGVSVMGRYRQTSSPTQKLESDALRTAARKVNAAAIGQDVQSLVSALRTLLPLTDSPIRADIEGLLAELETRIYSPGRENARIDDSLAERAKTIASQANR